MKKAISFLFGFLCLLCLTYCDSNSISSSQELTGNDSLYSYKGIVRVHLQQPELALGRIDTAQNKGLLSDDSCTLLRIIVHSSMNNYLESEKLAEDFLSNTSLDRHDLFYIKIISCLANDYLLDKKYELSLTYNLKGAKLAHESKNRKQEVSFNFNAGTCMIYLGNDNGFEYYDEAINLLKKDNNKNVLPTLSTYIGQKSRKLAEKKRFDDAIKACRERLVVIDKMKNNQNLPEGYIDQQKGCTLSVLAYCQSEQKDKQEAEKTIREFYNTNYSKTPDGYCDALSYEWSMNNGQRLIEICQRLHPLYLKRDTLNSGYANHLNCLAQGYRLLNRYREADGIMQRMDIVKDSVKSREQTSEALLMSELFRTQEKEFALASEKLNLKISRTISVTLMILLFVAIVSSLMILRYYKLSKRKNQVLVRQINEMMDCQRKIRQLKNSISNRNESLYDKIEYAKVESNNPDEAQKYNLALSALFEKLEHHMNDEHIYRDATLSRDSVMQLLNINRNQLSQMLNENANGISIISYINDYRIRRACEMMRENHESSMLIISKECGFSSVRTFNRLFKQHLGLTPLKYKDGLMN